MLARMTATQAKWLERVQQWQASGVRAEQFAQGKDYRPSTLVWYRTRLRREGFLQNDAGAPGSGAVGQRDRNSASKSQVAAARNRPNRAFKKAASSKLLGAPMPIARVVRSAALEPRVDAVVVEIGSARINIRSGFDASLLQQVVRALQYPVHQPRSCGRLGVTRYSRRERERSFSSTQAVRSCAPRAPGP